MLEVPPTFLRIDFHKYRRHALINWTDKSVIVDSTPLLISTMWKFKIKTCMQRRIQRIQASYSCEPAWLSVKGTYHTKHLLWFAVSSKTIEDLEAENVLADTGHRSKRNISSVREMNAVHVIPVNTHKKGKTRKIEPCELLRQKR